MPHDNADQIMDMLLAKKRASDRRDWLETKGNLASVIAPIIGEDEAPTLPARGRRDDEQTPTTDQNQLDFRASKSSRCAPSRNVRTSNTRCT